MRVEKFMERTVNSVMKRVYGYMAIGLVVSALMAALFAYVPGFHDFLYTANEAGETILTGMGIIILLSPLVVVLIMHLVGEDLDTVGLGILFLLFCILMGSSLSSIFLVYSEASIFMCFLISAGTFGAMTIYGLVTKSDLTSLGSILLMALIGIIIALVVNIFLRSAVMDYVVSLIAVVVFCGLTAYDSQKIQEELMTADDWETTDRIALMGALSLYLDFVNLLLHILRLLGKKD